MSAKSLLGNRFVGRHPSASIAASRRRGAFRATDIDGSGTDGGVPANKAIPEERLGRHPGGRYAARTTGSRECNALPTDHGWRARVSAVKAITEERHHRCTWNQSAASGGNRNRSRYGYP